MLIFDKNLRSSASVYYFTAYKVTVDAETNRKIDSHENLDEIFEKNLEEANSILLSDSIKRRK